MNLKKLNRLRGDLHQATSTQRALSAQYRDLKDAFTSTRNGILRTLSESRHKLPGFDGQDDLAVLLTCARDDLWLCGVDLRDVKRAIEARDEMADLQARASALDAETTPLIQLVDSLNRYVSEHANG